MVSLKLRTLVGVGARLEQCLDYHDMPLLRRHEERGNAVLATFQTNTGSRKDLKPIQ